MTLFYYPPKPGPGGAPCPWGGPETWMEPVGGGAPDPSPSLLGRRSHSAGRRQIPLEVSPVPLTVSHVHRDPDQQWEDRGATRRGSHARPCPGLPTRTWSHAVSLRGLLLASCW